MPFPVRPLALAALALAGSACGGSARRPAPAATGTAAESPAPEAATPEAATPEAATPEAAPDAAAGVAPAVVTLERTVCYGRCPVYTVSAFADGRVVFEGRAHVAKVGTAVGRVDPAVVAALVAQAEATDHAGYPDALTESSGACELVATDGPTATTTIRAAGGVSRVEHYGGCRGFAGEDALAAFEAEIDRALGTAAWVGPR